ncbi:MAG: hypothetical protein LQ338_006351 [Usnochroma carphineum]|nr:MAG: hypothetical protein LQ338_006351 [Usnochroma carphineum]
MSDTSPSAVIAVGVVMPVLGIATVGLRFYTRQKMRNQILIDDWLLLPALLFTIGMGASLIAGVRLHALGYHTPITGNPDDPLVTLTQTNSAITTTTQIEWAFQMIQILALGCVKLSFLFFYRRIFTTGISTWFNKATTGLIVIILVWTGAFFFALLFACKGTWSAWWGSVMDLSTKCVQTLKLELALVTSDFVTDVLVMVLPIPMIWRLHMSTSRKIAVTGIFLLGAVAIAASVVRMVQFVRVIQVGFDPHADEDLSLTANLYWSMVESGLGLMAVCLPTFRALFGQFSLDAMIQSFRSTFSLHSRASQTGSRPRNTVSKTELSGDSSEHLQQEHSTFETYAIRGDKVENGKRRVPDGKILVQSSIGRVEDWA